MAVYILLMVGVVKKNVCMMIPGIILTVCHVILFSNTFALQCLNALRMVIASIIWMVASSVAISMLSSVTGDERNGEFD